MPLLNAQHRALHRLAPAGGIKPSLVVSAERRAAHGNVAAAVIAAAATLVLALTTRMEFAASITNGSASGSVVLAAAFGVAAYLLSAPVFGSVFVSTLWMFCSIKGVKNLSTHDLRWAMKYSQKVLSHGTARHQAQMMMLCCRLWLLGVSRSKQEQFFALAAQTNCSLGELRLIVAKL